MIFGNFCIFFQTSRTLGGPWGGSRGPGGAPHRALERGQFRNIFCQFHCFSALISDIQVCGDLFYYVLDQHYPGAQKYGDFMKILGMKSQKLVFVQNFLFFYVRSFFASSLKFFLPTTIMFGRKCQKIEQNQRKKGKFLTF